MEVQLCHCGVEGAALWLFGPKLSVQKSLFNPNCHTAAGADPGFPAKVKEIVYQQFGSAGEPGATPIKTAPSLTDQLRMVLRDF